METTKLFDAELTVMEYLWEHGLLTAARMAQDLWGPCASADSNKSFFVF